MHTYDLLELGAAAQELHVYLTEMEVDIIFRQCSIELLVNKIDGLRITMDGDRDGHAPHVHIDLGKDKHVGSYTVHDGELVAGDANRYDKLIKKWIVKNRDLLERVYRDMRADGYNPEDVTTLLKTPFPKK